MQFQADILGLQIKRFAMLEATAFGAAKLAGLPVGLSIGENREAESVYFDRTFGPTMDEQTRKVKYEKWQNALSRSRQWDTTI